jgi:hypothetical protein
LVVNIEVTLEELFYGCKKDIFFEKIILRPDKRNEKFDVV